MLVSIFHDDLQTESPNSTRRSPPSMWLSVAQFDEVAAKVAQPYGRPPRGGSDHIRRV